MLRVLTTPSGVEVRLSSTAAFLYVYKTQFKSEPLKDIMSIAESASAADEDVMSTMQNLELEKLYNLAWALAKCADPSIGLPMEFFTENPDFLPLDHIEDITELALDSFTASVSVNEQAPKNVWSMPKK